MNVPICDFNTDLSDLLSPYFLEKNPLFLCRSIQIKETVTSIARNINKSNVQIMTFHELQHLYDTHPPPFQKDLKNLFYTNNLRSLAYINYPKKYFYNLNSLHPF